MGLFDKLRKNNISETAKETSAPTDEALVEREIDFGDILRMIASKYKNCKVNENTVYFEDFDLTLKVAIGDTGGEEGKYILQLVFIMSQPLFDESVIESCAGVGATHNEAIIMGVDGFTSGVLTYVLLALNCESKDEITSEINGEKSVFRIPCTTGTLHYGEEFIENHDLLALMKDEISAYLGKKRAYWVKLFISWIGTEFISEVSINNYVCQELSDKLIEKIGKPKREIKYGSEKQFVLLIQNDKTYTHCPYTKEQVTELTFDAIKRMSAITDQASYEAVKAQIAEKCPDESLCHDLITFIPEMYCKFIFNLKDGDSVTMLDPESKTSVNLKRTQLRSFGYIEEAVFNYININKPSKEFNQNILNMSARFNVLGKAVMAGSKVNDLVFPDLTFIANSGYIIR